LNRHPAAVDAVTHAARETAPGGGTEAPAARPAPAPAIPAGAPGPEAELLVATRITKRFGGLTALDDVSLSLRPGEIHGLIGPNGSGKTTMLNLLSGYYEPTSGAIRYRDEELGKATVQRRAVLGIARTFQKPRLLGALSVLDNATLGCWSHSRAGFVATLFGLPKVSAGDKVLREQAMELLHGVGLGHAIHRRANLLEHAEQRFLEIARGLALRPRFLLLDEPAGGLTTAEIDHLGGLLRTIRDAGIGVLLVEHHTDFVFRVCDRVTTLDVGRMIKHGTPAEVRSDPEVIRIYLGS
jgi:ABC-type branched-subunit amino acid transport system ATPase component